MTLPFNYAFGFPQGNFAPTTRKAQLDDILNSIRNGAMRATSNFTNPQPYRPPQQPLPSSVGDLLKSMMGANGGPTNNTVPTPPPPQLGTAAPVSPAVPPAPAAPQQAGYNNSPSPTPPPNYDGPNSQKAPGTPDFNAGSFGGQQGGQGQSIVPQFMNAFSGFSGGPQTSNPFGNGLIGKLAGLPSQIGGLLGTSQIGPTFANGAAGAMGGVPFNIF